jgi:hypothetical protein
MKHYYCGGFRTKLVLDAALEEFVVSGSSKAMWATELVEVTANRTSTGNISRDPPSYRIRLIGRSLVSHSVFRRTEKWKH